MTVVPCPKAAEQAGILRRHMKMIEPAGPSFENGRRELEVGEIPEVEALSMGKSSKCWVFPCYPCHV